MQNVDLSGFVTIGEAVALTSYHDDYLRKLAREGTLAALKVGTNWLLDRADLVAYKSKMDALGKMKHAPKATRGGESDDTRD